MKKVIVIAIVVMSLASFSTFSFAQSQKDKPTKEAVKEVVKSTEVFKGKITSIDPTKNEIVVKNNKTGTEKTFIVDPKEISSLKVGEEVKVTYKTGSNIADSIKKVVKKTKSTKK
jgi:hypothetical protein